MELDILFSGIWEMSGSKMAVEPTDWDCLSWKICHMHDF